MQLAGPEQVNVSAKQTAQAGEAVRGQRIGWVEEAVRAKEFARAGEVVYTAGVGKEWGIVRVEPSERVSRILISAFLSGAMVELASTMGTRNNCTAFARIEHTGGISGRYTTAA